MDFLEKNFQSFLRAGYRDKTLHPIQFQEVKRAFYGGAFLAANNTEKAVHIATESRDFIDEEVKNYVENN